MHEKRRPERQESGTRGMFDLYRQAGKQPTIEAGSAAVASNYAHQLFERQAGLNPRQTAITCLNQQLTYGELNAKANQLAHYLRAEGVGPHTLVGLAFERSVEIVIAILGVLKAGAAYLPLDPAYPKDRLAFMLADAQPCLMLTQASLANDLPQHVAQVLLLEQVLPIGATERGENLEREPAINDLAYVIYTSGSTGKPKGVMITHGNLAHYIPAIRAATGITATDLYLHTASISFSSSVRQLLLPLAAGAGIVVASVDEVRDPLSLFAVIRRLGVTVMDIVPSYWRSCVQALESLSPAARAEMLDNHLRLILSASEPLPSDIPSAWRFGFEHKAELINMFGQTETAGIVAVYPILPNNGEGVRTVPIGRPLDSAEIYLLDTGRRLVATGTAGEICIGGPCVGRGYLNHPELTAERFVDNPFSAAPGARLYRTGDLGRLRADGSLQFLGRSDNQVKIRGHRVEPGEVEAVLLDHSQVSDVVVAAREDTVGNKRLVAYVVPAASATVNSAELRAYLQEKLPEYMLPAAIVELDELPLTPNGKVDRRALPAPDYQAQLVGSYVPPRTETELSLCSIWAEVLKVERVGINDDFFDLGGDSLLATQIVSRVSRELKIQLLLRVLFECHTVSQMAESIKRAATTEQRVPSATPATSGQSIQPVSYNATAPLSFGQRSFWFLDSLTPNTALYSMFRAMRMCGQLDVSALQKALDALIARHESMRTTFASVDGTPVQIINEHQTFSLPEIDLCHLPAVAREAELRQLLQEQADRPFDLACGPVVRVTLFRLGTQEHVLMLSMHHIVADDWSMGIFSRELQALYEGFAAGFPPELPALPIQYADFAIWQQDWLQHEVLDKQLEYWQQQLVGAPPLLELPTNRPRPSAPSFSGAHHSMLLPRELRDRVVKLSQRESVSTFMTLLAAFQTLLARYSGQDDIVVGSPIAGRNRVETENLIGHFINTLVLRTDLSGDPAFSELLQRVREVALGAYAHQEVPFEKLVEELQPERSLSYTPLFQVMFVFQNAPKSDLDLNGLSISMEEIHSESSPLDLTLDVRETPEGLRCVFEYKTDLFDEKTITRLAQHFQLLLQRVVENPEQPLSALSLLTAGEDQQLLVEWNDTAREYPKALCIHELFEAQVEHTPDAPAVIFESQTLTYRQLNERANRLAHHLRSLGVGPDALVGICLERSPAMVVSVLGILKAGGAYLPLDPAYPSERLELMLRDADAAIVLTQGNLTGSLAAGAAKLVSVDDDWDLIACASADNPARVSTAENLAYVIYTSGSTGAPKGVMIEHRSLVNFTISARVEYRLVPGDRLLQFASLNFDTSAEEIFPCLTSGATLVLLTDEMISSAAEFLRQSGELGISVLDLPTAYWHELTAQLGAERLRIPSSLRLLIIGGERALPERLALWQQQVGPRVRLVNTYGPTETTIVATAYDASAKTTSADPRRELPIGRPLPNVTAYVLDRNLNPQPVGIVGELYLGGDGLARGYLNQPELTAKKFIRHPFSNDPQARLYQTGDLARYLADGNLEYVGRADEQVKMRGFRIEPGEIESVLRQHAAVRESVVVAREDAAGDKRLLAYVVSAAGARVNCGELRNYLQQKLPEYMLPAAIVELAEMPLTANGKVNRRALPAPDYQAQLVASYVGPRTPPETLLCDIWTEVLKLERVGVNDNFFELGGHSLLATQVISRLRDAFRVELPLRSIFEAPTITQLAERIEVARQSEQLVVSPPIQPVLRNGGARLSFAQERLWFIEQLGPNSSLYNVCRAVRLHGILDVAALQEALAAMLVRHEALRTNFVSTDGDPVQLIHARGAVRLARIDLRDRESEEREKEALGLVNQEAQRPFDLAHEPLLRATLLQLGEDENILVLTLHHIICDGWSMGILYRELWAYYDAVTRSSALSLPALPFQYADYAEWQRQWLAGEVLQSQLAYWKQRLEGAAALLALPTDRPRPAMQTFNGAKETLLLPDSLAEQLRLLSRREGTTLFMTLLTAFFTLLARYSGQDDIVVGSPIAGRVRTEMEGLIGLCVNTLVLRTDLSGDPTFQELLHRVTEVTLGAYAHQDLPFEKVVEELRPERNLSYHPLFQVMFAFRNDLLTTPEVAEITAEPVSIASHSSKFDLTLEIIERSDGLLCTLEYNTDLFDPATIARMLGHFRTLIEGVSTNPDEHISVLPLLPEAERQQLLVEWNSTRTAFPADRCAHELFAEQVQRDPEVVALVSGSQQLTYRELNDRANQLAHYLRKQGVGPEVLVGLCLERSVELIIGLLGILKAGGAYVPLDPAYPQERLAFMIEDAGARILLTQSRLRCNLPPHASNTICLDTDWSTVALESRENLPSGATPENLIYVMYTSGSSGQPKGVAVTHRNVVRLVKDTNYAQFTAAEVFLQFAPISFDASTFEIFGSLLNGARLVLMPAHMPTLDELGEALARYQVTTLWLTAGLFHLMVDNRVEDLRRLRQLLAGGDVLSAAHIRKLLSEGGQVRLSNGYGPTENTTFTCCYQVPSSTQLSDSVPLGRPIANTSVYVLDRNLQPVPIGVIGELYAGGDGVARGYFNRPELTEQCFIPDPFSDRPGARLYRTGDLARYLPDGNIQFLGRSDSQVKIRGFRVEPGEIEAVIATHPSVQRSIVVPHEEASGDKRLVAYILPTATSGTTTEDLRCFLKQKLPEYMTPSLFVLVDEFKLTPEGKVDRRALPSPDTARAESEEEHVAPRDDLELQLTKIWERVLDLRPIGLTDNFFALGGHSLLAVRLFAQIEKVFRRQLPLATLFQAPTVEQLAQVMRQKGWTPPWSSLVAIQPEGSKRPFFCVHALGGNVLEYYDLARYLGNDRPFYAFQAHGLDGKQALFTRTEEMGAHYVKEMREVQPDGPYLIGGRSFGGLVAFEMACQLREQGEEVALLALLGTYPAGYFQLFPQSDRSVYSYSLRSFAERMKYHVDNLRQLRLAARFDYLAEKARKAPEVIKRLFWLRTYEFFRSTGHPLPHTLRDIEELNRGASREYVPRVYPGRVTLFWATGELTPSSDAETHWREVVSGGIEVRDISGNHLNIVQEPFVQDLARELKTCLDATDVALSSSNCSPATVAGGVS